MQRGRQRFRVYPARGVRFVFRVEPGTDLLHICVRHLTTPEEAMNAFFAGWPDGSQWNERYQRFETTTATHGLFWFWLEPNRAVMVITCFRL